MDKDTLYRYNTFLTTKCGKDDREKLWNDFVTPLRQAFALEWPSDKNTGEAIRWVKEYDVPEGFPRQRFDIGCTVPSTRVCIAIEFEVRRSTAVRNINKAWMAADKARRKYRMIQIFSPLFTADHSHAQAFSQRLAEARFIGEKAHKDLRESFTYLPIPIETWPLEDQTLITTLIREIETVIQPGDGL